MEIDARNAGGDQVGVGLGVQRRDDGFLHYQRFSLVHGVPAGVIIGHIRAGGAVLDQLVIFRVAPETIVVGGVGDPHAQVGHRVGVVRAPAGEGYIVVVVLHLVQALSLGHGLQVQRYAGQVGFHLALDGLRHLGDDVALVVAVDQGEGEAILAQLFLGLGQVFKRLFHVEVAVIDELHLIFGEVGTRGAAGGELRGNRGVGSQRAVHDVVFHDGFAVDSVGDGQAQVGVGQHAAVGVLFSLAEGEVPHVARAGYSQLAGQLSVLLGAGNLVAADRNHIQRASLEGDQGVIGGADHLILDASQLYAVGIPVIGVLLHR